MHELWFTRLLNEHIPGPANWALSLIGWHAEDPAKPWTSYMAMEVLIVLLLLALPLLARQFSVDKPGKLQQLFEVFYEFVRGQANDVVGHDGPKHVFFFGTLFLFILFSNLLGLIPTMESPTMYPPVPLGCALAAFLYYQFWGVAVQGPVGHLKHFLGPVWWMAPFMLVVEIISHLVRPLSLTVRLFANMLAGELVTLNFLSMWPVGTFVSWMLMGLHTFVSLLQAFIFMTLAMLYLGEAIAHEEAH